MFNLSKKSFQRFWDLQSERSVSTSGWRWVGEGEREGEGGLFAALGRDGSDVVIKICGPPGEKCVQGQS